jgi:hypothetical protein
MDMKASCRDGVYKSVTNGGPAWFGKCELVGTAARPCFHLSGGGPKEAFSKVEMRQCFDIAGPACKVEMNGVMIGRVDPVKGESVQALTEQKSCAVE